jgi:hypothetical protein
VAALQAAAVEDARALGAARAAAADQVTSLQTALAEEQGARGELATAAGKADRLVAALLALSSALVPATMGAAGGDASDDTFEPTPSRSATASPPPGARGGPRACTAPVDSTTLSSGAAALAASGGPRPRYQPPRPRAPRRGTDGGSEVEEGGGGSGGGEQGPCQAAATATTPAPAPAVRCVEDKDAVGSTSKTIFATPGSWGGGSPSPARRPGV